MSARPGAMLDPRGWLVWGAAAMTPALVGRNPLVLAVPLIAVLGVRAAWSTTTPRVGLGWGWLVRLALLFAAIGALFNLLTAHVGDRVLVALPGSIPIVGGPLTLNALVYGLISGAAVLLLVVTGATLGLLLDGPALLRLLPARLTTVAVAGSVAWAFVPQTAAAFLDIRDAQRARGHRLRGARDLVPVLAPLLASGLERALGLAEALESRAFGAPLGPIEHGGRAMSALRHVVIALGLTGALVGAYLLAVGQSLPAIVLLIGATFALIAVGREPARSNRLRRTRYRQPVWTSADTVIAAIGSVVLAGQITLLAIDPGAFAYEPYPRLTAPTVDLRLMLVLALLVVPAYLAPEPDTEPQHQAQEGGDRWRSSSTR